MNSVLLDSATAAIPPPEHDLAQGIARLSTDFEALLRNRFPASEGIVAQAIEFLAQTAQTIRTTPLPAAMVPGDTPLGRLIDGYALEAEHIDLLVLAGLAEEHEGYADIFRALHPRAQPRPSTGLAAQLLEQGGSSRERIRELLVTGPLVMQGILHLAGEGPLFERDLELTPGLWSGLHGLAMQPPGVTVDRSPVTRAGLDEWLREPDTQAAMTALRRSRSQPFTLVVAAEQMSNAFHRAAALVEAAGLRALRVPLPTPPDTALIERIGVHAIVAGRIPLLGVDPGDGSPQPAMACDHGFPAPLIWCCPIGAEPTVTGRALLRLMVERPSTVALARMWRELLPELAGSAAELAARFPLEPHQAATVVADLHGPSAGESHSTPGTSPTTAPDLAQVSARVRARGVARLKGGVRLIRPQADWDALVLPPHQLSQLHEAVDRLRLQARVLDEWGFLEGRRGARGVRLLLSGPSGTGKTLSAEVLAKALDVDLLLVDLSRVVSKWIGETEKNLAEVFDTAEQARAVLLFDEADALFGKRTQISDAHDRYANLETAYLLNRLERFDGLVALSTNLRQNIDSAFLRRLDFIIEYQEPDREQRLALWRCHLPDGAPLAADMDVAQLAAQFPIVGGLIRNAALSAAFMAAANDTSITRGNFLRAIRLEYEKAGKSFREPPGQF